MNIIKKGAGPTGMMCAIKAKNENNNVTIIEKNDKTGKKLLLTGSGRCNYANEIITSDCYFTENSDLIENIIQNTVFKTLNAWSNFTGFTSEKLNELKNSDFDEDD